MRKSHPDNVWQPFNFVITPCQYCSLSSLHFIIHSIPHSLRIPLLFTCRRPFNLSYLQSLDHFIKNPSFSAIEHQDLMLCQCQFFIVCFVGLYWAQ